MEWLLMIPIFVRILSDIMVTFHPVCISSNRRRDGSYPVKIRVTFKGVSRRLATNLIARAGDLTRTLHIKNPDILNKANDLIRQMQGTFEDVSPFVLDGWDVDMVVAHIKSSLKESNFKLDFFAFADAYLGCKTDTTRRAYDMALNSFARFLGRREIEINSISKSLLLSYIDFVDNSNKLVKTKDGWVESDREKSRGQSSLLLMKLAHIYSAAQMKFNDEQVDLIPRHPFDSIPRNYQPSKGQKALTIDIIRKMLDSDRWEVQTFVLSFCLMGANLADMYAAKKFKGDTWIYHRQKTERRRKDGAEVQVVIQPQVKPIIEKLSGCGDWWLNLHRFKSKDLCTQVINKGLRKWAGENGVEDFTFYAARKSWGTIARRLGVEKATIDEGLAHKGDFALTDIYVERDWGLINEANRKVVSTLFG